VQTNKLVKSYSFCLTVSSDQNTWDPSCPAQTNALDLRALAAFSTLNVRVGAVTDDGQQSQGVAIHDNLRAAKAVLGRSPLVRSSVLLEAVVLRGLVVLPAGAAGLAALGTLDMGVRSIAASRQRRTKWSHTYNEYTLLQSGRTMVGSVPEGKCVEGI